MTEILHYIGVGGAVAVLLGVFFEITPIKINPLQWMGKRINKEMLDKIDQLDNKLDQHIVQSYRNTILNFQNELLHDKKHTQEQFKVVLGACTAYDKFIEDNNLKNGEVEEATKYIKRVYQKCLEEHNFVDLVKEG